MLEFSFAAKQILRLSGLRFFPSEPEAQDELVVALRHVAKNEDDATGIVSGWLRDSREAPTPFDLYEVGRNRGPEPTSFSSDSLLPSNGYDPNAEYAEWAKKNIRRVK